MTHDVTTGTDQSTLQTTLDSVDRQLRQTIAGLGQQWAELAGPEVAILGELDLPQLLRRSVDGGKRVRPAMVHWGWTAAGAPTESHDQMITLGTALELLHAFAITHDDVMDRSALRRGQPTCHVLAAEAHRRARGPVGAELFGDSIAVLVGDLAHAEADHLIGSLPAPVRAGWRQMMIELVLGQRADLVGSGADQLSAIEVARLKTGSYTIQRPLQLGALLAGASAATLDCLDRFGDHVGRAYGLRDDILGTFGDPQTTGKPVDDDLTAGKQTVLLALARQLLSPRSRALLDRTGTDRLTADEIDQLRTEMITCGVREEVESLITAEIATAVAGLATGHLDPAGVEGLTAAAQRLAWRAA